MLVSVLVQVVFRELKMVQVPVAVLWSVEAPCGRWACAVKHRGGTMREEQTLRGSEEQGDTPQADVKMSADARQANRALLCATDVLR